jgi:4-amino-4-deoxy-L-arabinose transferase-like glycosyltransferase
MIASAPVDATSSRRAWWLFAAVMMAALAIRGGALWALRGNLQADPDGYRALAENVLAEGVFGRFLPLDVHAHGTSTLPTAYRPPLYPLLLSALNERGVVSLTAVALWHVILGLLTVAITYRIATLWNLHGAAPIAALLVACDPILVNQSAQVMTETLATLLAVLGLWQATRFHQRRTLGNAIGVGVVVGLAALCRPTFLLWALPLSVVVLCWQLSWPRRIALATALSLGVLAAMSPWVIRNYRTFRVVKFTTTHGGYTLWLANNPDYYDWLRSGKGTAWPGPTEDEQVAEAYKLGKFFLFSTDQPERIDRAWHRWSQEGRHFDFTTLEFDADAEFKDRAWETIRAQPGTFVYASLLRVGHLWSPLPQQTSPSESTLRKAARYLVAIWYVGVYLLAFAGAAKLKKELLGTPWMWGLTLCLVFTAVHAVYWSNLRMRAPLMPVVALLAGAAFCRVHASAQGAMRDAEPS